METAREEMKMLQIYVWHLSVRHTKMHNRKSFTKDISSRDKESSYETLRQGVFLTIPAFWYEGLGHS